MKISPYKTTPAGMSMLELVVAMTMMATLSTPTRVLLRTSQSAWSRHQADYARRLNAVAAARQMVRQIRQAASVTAISAATDVSGTLSIERSNGDIYVWDHDNGADQVLFGQNTATDPLADSITALSFTGYKADGTTATVAPELIYSVRCELSYEVERPSGPATEQITTQAWLRRW